ncbi:MAG: FtsH protease activity modulator HflK [Steroidobacteraceae bacterium]
MAWNESGGTPGGKKNPWGNNRPGKGPPDLDEVLRNLQRKLSAFMGGGAGRGSVPGGGGGAAAAGFGAASLVVILLAIWGFTGLYQVDAAERAVVLRFGKYAETTQPGLRWHIPWPIESKQIVNVSSIEGFSEQTRMLTADENLVDINLDVQFRRADPLQYVFNVRDPETTLKEISESAIRETIGRSTLNSVLESGRQEIATNTKDLIQRTLNAYEVGIEVTTVNLQGVSVPEQVAPAQQDAIKAREDKERSSLEAQTYANDLLPRAGGEASRLEQDAQAYLAQKVAEAEGSSQRFTQLLAEYERAPAVTRERLYLETVELVLRNSKKVIVDTKGNNNMLYLPLDRMVTPQGSVTVRDVTPETTIRTVTPSGQPQGSQDPARARGTR